MGNALTTPRYGRPHKIRVLMTSHNRCEITRACLESLARQEGVVVKVTLTDDGSSDGTSDMAADYPFVRVVTGGGHDYWAGGMRRAWRASEGVEADATLLLNDDVILDPGALERLMGWVSSDRNVLWGAAVRSKSDGKVTYGGYVSQRRSRRLNMALVEPGDSPTRCDVLNGNILFLTPEVISIVGGISSRFSHGMADFELSWRASGFGVRSVLAPGTWGECDVNSVTGTWRDPTMDRASRWAKVCAPTGLPPREYGYVCRKYGGPLWMLDFMAPYLRILLGIGPRRG